MPSSPRVTARKSKSNDFFSCSAALSKASVSLISTPHASAVSFLLGVSVLAAALVYPVLAGCISSDFARSALPIALILCIGVWLNALAAVPYTLLHAKGNPRLTAIFHMVELLLYLLALWMLTTRFGLLGAAWAWVARVGLDWLLLHFAARRLYGV